MDLGNATLSWYRLLISPARGEVPKVDLGIANKQTRHESWKPFQTPWDREKALNFSPRAGGRRTMVFLLVVSARMRFGVPLFWFCFRQPRRVLQARVWYLRIVGAICEGRRSVLRTSRQAGAALFGRGREKGQDVEERCGVRSTIVDTYVARRQKSVLSHHQICREGWASQAGGRSEGSRGRESSAQGWGPEGGGILASGSRAASSISLRARGQRQDYPGDSFCGSAARIFWARS